MIIKELNLGNEVIVLNQDVSGSGKRRPNRGIV
jgi:hypothetical protein